MCKLYSNGTVYVTPPAIITTSCKLNVENYPYDQKQCSMTWGSWMYTKDVLLIINSSRYVNLNSYVENSEWNLECKYIYIYIIILYNNNINKCKK